MRKNLGTGTKKTSTRKAGKIAPIGVSLENDVNVSDVLETIKQMEDSLSDSKAERDRLLGQQTALINSLNEDFGVSGISEAKEELESLLAEIKDVQVSVHSSMKKIKNHFSAIGGL